MRAMVPQYNMSRYYRIIMFHPWPYGHWSFGVCALTQFELSRYPKKNSTRFKACRGETVDRISTLKTAGPDSPRPARGSAYQPLSMGARLGRSPEHRTRVEGHRLLPVLYRLVQIEPSTR